MTRFETAFTKQVGIDIPIICGAMYPCSNPELVAAVSDAGGIGIVQPISLTYVYRHEFRAGLRLIKQLTPKPVGMNALIEASSRRYHEKMVEWVTIAMEEGLRFFIPWLGNPRWVCERVHAAGGKVYHDVTERKWALKGRDAGVDGLIGVNRRAGGQGGPLSAEATLAVGAGVAALGGVTRRAGGPGGPLSAEQLLAEVADLGLPVVCAGGIGDQHDFA